MKPTIVFLHGLSCSSKIFSYLHSQLPSHNSVFIEYRSQDPLQDSLNAIVEQLPKRPFVIVGHSLGGVIGHLITTQTTLPVNKLVTISSPFGGSQAAGILRWIYPRFRIFRDLAPNSNLLNALASSTPSCPFLSLVSIAGHLPFISEENDGVVTVRSQSCVPATERINVNSNHFEAVQDQTTISSIRRFVFEK